MNSFKRLASNKPLIVVLALAVGWLSPPAAAYRLDRAEALVRSAEGLDGSPAIARLRAALWLANTDGIADKLADEYTSSGHSYEAMLLLRGRGDDSKLRAATIAYQAGDYEGSLTLLDALKQPGRGDRLAAYNLLELSRLNDAVAKAQASGENEPWRCFVAYAAERGGECEAMTPTLTAPEAVKRVSRLRTGKLAQAQELYAERLVLSAQRLLEKTDNPNSEVAILLARIRLSDPSSSNEKLRQIDADLQSAITNQPGNLDLHQLRYEVLVRLKDQDAAQLEQRLIDQLESGRI